MTSHHLIRVLSPPAPPGGPLGPKSIRIWYDYTRMTFWQLLVCVSSLLSGFLAGLVTHTHLRRRALRPSHWPGLRERAEPPVHSPRRSWTQPNTEPFQQRDQERLWQNLRTLSVGINRKRYFLLSLTNRKYNYIIIPYGNILSTRQRLLK